MKKQIFSLMGALVMVFLTVSPSKAEILQGVLQGTLRNVYSDFITLTPAPEVNKSYDNNRFTAGEIAVNIDYQTHYDNNIS